MSHLSTHTWQEGKYESKVIRSVDNERKAVLRRTDYCVDCGCQLVREKGNGIVRWKVGALTGRSLDYLPACTRAIPLPVKSFHAQHEWIFDKMTWKPGTIETLKCHRVTYGMVREIFCKCGLRRRDIKPTYSKYRQSYSYFGPDLIRFCPPCPLYKEHQESHDC